MLKYFFIVYIISLITFTSLSYARELTDNMICKAGIATIMGRELDTIQVLREKHQIIYLSYKREEDGVTWKFKCQLDGSKIIWASEMGSWRNTGLDSRIKYKIEDGTLAVTETYNSGAFIKKEYFVKDLLKD